MQCIALNRQLNFRAPIISSVGNSQLFFEILQLPCSLTKETGRHQFTAKASERERDRERQTDRQTDTCVVHAAGSMMCLGIDARLVALATVPIVTVVTNAHTALVRSVVAARRTVKLLQHAQRWTRDFKKQCVTGSYVHCVSS